MDSRAVFLHPFLLMLQVLRTAILDLAASCDFFYESQPDPHCACARSHGVVRLVMQSPRTCDV